MNLAEIIIILVLLAVLAIILFLFRSMNRAGGNKSNEDIQQKLSIVESSLNKIDTGVRDEFSRNRDEINRNSKDAREELGSTLKQFNEAIIGNMGEMAKVQNNLLDSFANQLQSLTKLNEEKFEALRKSIEDRMSKFQDQISNSAKINRDDLNIALKAFEENFSRNVKDFNDLQKQKFDDMGKKQDELIKATDDKLEKMRNTVDEKLHETLEKRLGEAFKSVSERLELVHKGLGEMQTLATGVGDLKKVLSNVKTKGVLGEYQLQNLLEQLLTPEQYALNVKTKAGSNDPVEFAIKLPGKEEGRSVWLPIDSKFPTEIYQELLSAYDNGDREGVDKAQKALSATIKNFAKDISTKYLDPPNTTEFGIMFLPFEGLYAEVLRINGLFEIIQRDYRIIITGPTTLSATLNSLQMGFRTLAIEKRSSEVWQVLGEVKTEFTKFGDILDKTHKKLQEASNVIEDASKKSRTIQRKLKDVQELPAVEVKLIEDGE